MRAWVIAFILTGCGTQVKVSGSTNHTVGGEARIVNEIVIKLDVSACEALAGQSQADCIRESVEALGDLVELVKTLNCKDPECLGEQQ